ncbi:MAG: hypothetical protein GY828_02115 [Candidatus Gracilibacteria bacterium]|nr:hypothetical protein [Candidatus Gracilibacteria bacterium]
MEEFFFFSLGPILEFRKRNRSTSISRQNKLTEEKVVPVDETNQNNHKYDLFDLL